MVKDERQSNKYLIKKKHHLWTPDELGTSFVDSDGFKLLNLLPSPSESQDYTTLSMYDAWGSNPELYAC